jgi:leucyl-tRNA synthetase
MTSDTANLTRKAYPHHIIEKKWQNYWVQNHTFRTPGPGDPDFDPSKQKYYILDMFPYPSGSGLHVGHPEGYTATDILARYNRMLGKNVLHPMGWDAFGLPAEQYAIKTGQHPRITTEKNIATFRNQLKSLGFSYDWNREVNTTDPGYIKWTQWIFLQIYNSYYCQKTQRARPIAELFQAGLSREQIDARRLAYVAEATVNWSPDLGTVLANEEVEEWRAKGHEVIRRPLRQWMLRITDYAERLIKDLDLLDWPESIKLLQRNWIGRSEGAEIQFQLPDAETLTVFTTRPDTLFGATYMVLAPEHPLVEKLTAPEQRPAVNAYREACAKKTDLERTELAKEKTGVPLGTSASHPVTGKKIPLWIADYVLMGYGTGAIMAVPAHDVRDYEFAQKFHLPIQSVVADKDGSCSLPFTDDGIAINSEFLNGLPTPLAKEKMIQWLEQNKKGTRRIQYKLRDWLFSRQRYWGEPFPILWDKDGNHHPLPENELPLLPPELDDFRPTGDPRGPLAKATQWLTEKHGFTRETNTMPQWAGSCWYYLRYIDPHNNQQFIDPTKERYWLGGGSPGGVDLYVGGTEHAVLHLLYARFWHKVLFDLGHLSTPEPFQRLVNQGLILGEDGQKMSKSLGNVVNPDDVVRDYGADSLRCFEMFMGPLEQTKPWSTAGVEGVHRFLARAWRLFVDTDPHDDGKYRLNSNIRPVENPPADAEKITHRTIKKVTDDIEAMRFNTAISALMEWVNHFTKHCATGQPLPKAHAEIFTLLLSPFAPHIAEEFWQLLGHEKTLANEQWPQPEQRWLIDDTTEIVIQINGKVRAHLHVPRGLDRQALQDLALKDPKTQQLLAGATIKKTISVPDKLVNIVI